jgi:cytochrome c5
MSQTESNASEVQTPNTHDAEWWNRGSSGRKRTTKITHAYAGMPPLGTRNDHSQKKSHRLYRACLAGTLFSFLSLFNPAAP